MPRDIQGFKLSFEPSPSSRASLDHEILNFENWQFLGVDGGILKVKIKVLTVFGQILRKYPHFAWFMGIFTINSDQCLIWHQVIAHFELISNFLPESRAIAWPNRSPNALSASLLATSISLRLFHLPKIDFCHVKAKVLSFLLSPVRAPGHL